MLSAFRTIEIPVAMQDGSVRDISVPFTVELLHRVEETVNRTTGRVWFVVERSDKSIIDAFEDFCRPYLPEDFDFEQADPTFCAVFFSHVKGELLNSINDCMTSTERTETPTSPTEERTTKDDPSPPSTES